MSTLTTAQKLTHNNNIYKKSTKVKTAIVLVLKLVTGGTESIKTLFTLTTIQKLTLNKQYLQKSNKAYTTIVLVVNQLQNQQYL